MIDTTEATFEIDVLASPAALCVAYFTAPWCGPCRMLKPRLDELESENEGLTVARIDVSIESTQFAESFQIRSVPTLLLYAAGLQVGRVDGIKPKKELQTEFAKWL